MRSALGLVTVQAGSRTTSAGPSMTRWTTRCSDRAGRQFGGTLTMDPGPSADERPYVVEHGRRLVAQRSAGRQEQRRRRHNVMVVDGDAGQYVHVVEEPTKPWSGQLPSSDKTVRHRGASSERCESEGRAAS